MNTESPFSPFAQFLLLQAFLVEHDDGDIDMVGNRTEGALLILLRSWGRNYKTVREQRHDDIANLYGFSSAKKMASVMLKIDGGLRLYNKVHHTASPLRQDAKHGIYICLGCFKVAASVMLKVNCACSS